MAMTDVHSAMGSSHGSVAAIVDKAIQLSAITQFDLQFVDNFRDNKESLKVRFIDSIFCSISDAFLLV